MVVVITGASAGIGRALAEELAPRGAKLVLAARRLERLEEVNRRLGGGHLCVRADVSKTEDCKHLVDRSIAHYGRIDTLVCNAGYGIYQRVAQTTPQQTREIFTTNVFGTTDCIYFAVPHMQGQAPIDGCRGQIVIVSSVVARRGIPYIGMYSATKAAQLALGEALRVELRGDKIAVTTVHPITTRTEFGQVAKEQGQIRLPDTPMGFEQTAQTVAMKIRRAIVRPRPELWPARSSRWALGIGSLAPRLVDRAVARYRREVEEINPANTPGPD
jgi:short-subunit dehydrogenase